MKVPTAKLFLRNGAEVLYRGKNILLKSLQTFQYEFDEGEGDKCQISMAFSKLDFNIQIFEPGSIFLVRWGYIKQLSNARLVAVTDFKLVYNDNGHAITIVLIPLSDYVDKYPGSSTTQKEELLKKIQDKGTNFVFQTKGAQGTTLTLSINPNQIDNTKAFSITGVSYPTDLQNPNKGMQMVYGPVHVSVDQRFYTPTEFVPPKPMNLQILDYISPYNLSNNETNMDKGWVIPLTYQELYTQIAVSNIEKVKKGLALAANALNGCFTSNLLDAVTLYLPGSKIDTRDNDIILGIPNREAPAKFVAMPGRNIISLTMKKRDQADRDGASGNQGVIIDMDKKTPTGIKHEIKYGYIYTGEGLEGTKVQYYITPDEIWAAVADDVKSGDKGILLTSEEAQNVRETFKRAEEYEKNTGRPATEIITNKRSETELNDLYSQTQYMDESYYNYLWRNQMLTAEDVRGRLTRIYGGISEEEFINKMIDIELSDMFHTLEITLVMPGNPFVESKMDLNFLVSGVNPRIDGKYHAEKITHHLSNKDYTVTFVAYRIDYDIIRRRDILRQKYTETQGISEDMLYKLAASAMNELTKFKDLIEAQDQDLGYRSWKYLNKWPEVIDENDAEFFTVKKMTPPPDPFETSGEYSKKQTPVPQEEYNQETDLGDEQ
jgi:hypothetical protein